MSFFRCPFHRFVITPSSDNVAVKGGDQLWIVTSMFQANGPVEKGFIPLRNLDTGEEGTGGERQTGAAPSCFPTSKPLISLPVLSMLFFFSALDLVYLLALDHKTQIRMSLISFS